MKLPFTRPKNSPQGFSTLELVIVIAILAVVAITAANKLLNISDDAQLANLNDNASALQQGVDFAHAKWLTSGHSQEVRNLAGYADGTLDMNPNGYPIGTNKGQRFRRPFNIPNRHNGCIQIWQTLLTKPPSVASGNNNADFRAYRYRGDEGHNSMCDFVLRKLGDTRNRRRSELKITYNSFTGEVSVNAAN